MDQTISFCSFLNKITIGVAMVGFYGMSTSTVRADLPSSDPCWVLPEDRCQERMDCQWTSYCMGFGNTCNKSVVDCKDPCEIHPPTCVSKDMKMEKKNH